MLKLSVTFFSGETDTFNISQYHGFITAQKFNFWQKMPQKLPFLLSVSSETGDKKKEPGFLIKLPKTSTLFQAGFIRKPGSFVFLLPVSLETDNKNVSFCDSFCAKVEFLGSFMKP